MASPHSVDTQAVRDKLQLHETSHAVSTLGPPPEAGSSFLKRWKAQERSPRVAVTPSHRPRNLLPMGQVLVRGHDKSCRLNPHWGKQEEGPGS